ncbi:MAG: hypothetical protein ACI9LN_004770 [Saprospiraceae bacterium]|jgi:hypothetical protein
MKFIISTISFLFLNILSISGQNFVKENSQWDILFTNASYNMNTLSYKFEGDTIFNGELYKVLWISTDEFNEEWNITQYVRETSDGKIYDSEDRLHYDFALSVGDTIDFSSDCTQQISAIDSIFLLDGTPRKRWEISAYNNPWNTGVTDYWIEGIGSVHLITNYGLAGCSLDGGIYQLTCYHENNELLYQAGEPCFFTSTLEKETPFFEMSIFPNPVSSSLSVQLSNHQNLPYNLKISTIDGKTVKFLDKKNGDDLTEITVNNYAKGIYFLQIIYNEQVLKTERFVVF